MRREDFWSQLCSFCASSCLSVPDQDPFPHLYNYRGFSALFECYCVCPSSHCESLYFGGSSISLSVLKYIRGAISHNAYVARNIRLLSFLNIYA